MIFVLDSAAIAQYDLFIYRYDKYCDCRHHWKAQEAKETDKPERAVKVDLWEI